MLAAVGVASMTSCSDYLDVNDNPNSATNVDALYYQRLAHIEFYTNDAQQFGAMRTNMGCGDWTMNSRTSTYGAYSQWQPMAGVTTTPYQWWFVGAAANLADMENSAMEAGAWHYVGVGRIIRAYGFMLMTDIYGEMPYTEAVALTNIPAYDTGKTIFQGCLDDIDMGLEYLSKTQEEFTEPLSAGDFWAAGSVDKWIKFANLLKARFLLHLSKKGAGSASDLKYDAQAILDALAKGPQSNKDNIVINHTDDNGPTHDVLGWNEPVDYSPLYSVIGMNSNYFVTRMLVDNLTNFGEYGVEDPRADRIIPWARSQKSANTPEEIYGQKVKWSEDGLWRRSVGVDMNTTIRTEGAPYATSWDDLSDKDITSKYSSHPGITGFYCQSETRSGDTIFVQQRSGSTGYYKGRSLLMWLDNQKGSGDDRSAISGTFMTRVSSPGWVGTYHEACFIKAEVLYNQGKTSEAYAAYKEGIRANMELMNEKLTAWQAESKDDLQNNCPSFQVMTDEEIDNYLENGIGTAADLTLGHIMTQKHIAMMEQLEQWNDMRRYDYDEAVFFNWHIPAEYYINGGSQSCIPLGKHLRRWRQCSHEINYNSTNLGAIGALVPGSNGTANWNSAADVWSINVWWDSDQD